MIILYDYKDFTVQIGRYNGFPGMSRLYSIYLYIDPATLRKNEVHTLYSIYMYELRRQCNPGRKKGPVKEYYILSIPISSHHAGTGKRKKNFEFLPVIPFCCSAVSPRPRVRLSLRRAEVVPWNESSRGRDLSRVTVVFS